MTSLAPGYPVDSMYYLSRAEVIKACTGIDVLAVVADALRQHTAGTTILPAEAYLGWQASNGTPARSLAMPGGLRTGDRLTLGVKVINGCLSNPDRGLARAEGLILLFDAETAWPTAIMEAAYISALRTAAVTAITAQRLARPDLARLAIIGCGTLARAHLELLLRVLPQLEQISVYDISPQRREQLAGEVRSRHPSGHPAITQAGTPRDCVRGADLIVTTTTTTTGYLAYDWLSPGALIAHVSLDDVLPEVVQRARLLLVDDWNLVSQDSRRLLGRLYRTGRLRSVSGGYYPGCTPDPAARAVDATLGDILLGNHPGRKSPDDIVLSNPFGMSVLDIAVAHAVLAAAPRSSVRELPR
jgi:N-[(2S)-2-amino-2-carboxyethyl]-L-glutamate dehydrogenase